MKKRRQHHVWQHYLNSWTIDGRICCLKGGDIFATDTIDVAVQRDFYKLHKLTQVDIGLLRTLIIDHAHPLLKINHEEFLTLITAPVRFVENNRNKLRNIEKIDALLDVYMTNVLEDYHERIEHSFEPLLDRIINNDITFYSNEDSCITLFNFVSTQYMRTKKLKDKTIELIKQKNGHDLTRIWNIMSHMFAVNIGASLFAEWKKRKLVLVHNHTGVTFVTGDQPIINLHAGTAVPPTKLSLYYPISPCLALILSEPDEEPSFSTESLTSMQAAVLNEKMLAACHTQVFGQSEASLIPLRDRT